MQTKGTVTSVIGEYADVEVRRRVMCDGCPRDPRDPNACGHACAMGSLLGDRKNMTVRVKNRKNAVEGDTVILESPDRTVIFSAFLFFILPLLLAAAGYIFGGLIAFDYAPAAGAALGFVLAYVPAALLERRAKRSDAVIVMKDIVPRT